MPNLGKRRITACEDVGLLPPTCNSSLSASSMNYSIQYSMCVERDRALLPVQYDSIIVTVLKLYSESCSSPWTRCYLSLRAGVEVAGGDLRLLLHLLNINATHLRTVLL